MYDIWHFGKCVYFLSFPELMKKINITVNSTVNIKLLPATSELSLA